MIQALLLGIIGFIANCDYALGTSLIKNPIVTGPLVGLVMGDLTQGVIIGGVLELAFIGAQSVTLAYPIALLAAVVENVFMSFIFPIAGTWADKYAAQGDYRKIELIHMGGGLFQSVVFGALCTFGFMLGSAQVEAVVNAIPTVITDGLTVATGILPAMGFAMLAQMTVNKKVVVFFAIGFVLSSYMGVPVLGIAILGVAAAILQTGLLNGDAPVAQAVIDGGDDDDF